MSVGGCYLCNKSMLNFINVETSTTLWFLFSTILFSLFFLGSGNLGGFKTIANNYRRLLPLSLVSSGAALLWFYGTNQTEATDVAFMLQFIRVFSVIFGIVLLGERSSKSEGVGIFLAVIGALTLTYGGDGTTLISTLILLGSAFCYATANLLAKIYVKKMDAPSLAAGRSMFILFFVSAYTVLMGRTQTDISTNVFILAILGAFMAPFLGYLLFYKALSMLEISKVMAVRCSDPFFTLIYSFIAFSSTPTIKQLIGGTLIVVGVLILSLAKGEGACLS